MLLRVAIGWHFGTEGVSKYESYQSGGKPFSAEEYLRNATGPFARYFRGLIPDVNGLDRLDPEKFKASLRDETNRLVNHFGLAGDKQAEAGTAQASALAAADAWFQDRDNRDKLRKYIDDLRAVQKIEWSHDALSYERERARTERKQLDTERKEMLQSLDAIVSKLHDDVLNLATPEQAAAAGPIKAVQTSLDRTNEIVTYGLIAIGFCMMGGLFTRLAAFGGAFFLLNIYFSMPPWPGLPESPKWEGHYRYVDKNLIEAIACLALVFLPTGHWVGLDALVFGRRRHRRELERARALEQQR